MIHKIVVFGPTSCGKTSLTNAVQLIASSNFQFDQKQSVSSAHLPVQISTCTVSNNDQKKQIFQFFEVNISSPTTQRLFPSLSVNPHAFVAMFDCK